MEQTFDGQYNLLPVTEQELVKSMALPEMQIRAWWKPKAKEPGPTLRMLAERAVSLRDQFSTGKSVLTLEQASRLAVTGIPSYGDHERISQAVFSLASGVSNSVQSFSRVDTETGALVTPL